MDAPQFDISAQAAGLIDFLKANAPWLGKAVVDGIMKGLEEKYPDEADLIEMIRLKLDGLFPARDRDPA